MIAVLRTSADTLIYNRSRLPLRKVLCDAAILRRMRLTRPVLAVHALRQSWPHDRSGKSERRSVSSGAARQQPIAEGVHAWREGSCRMSGRKTATTSKGRSAALANRERGTVAPWPGRAEGRGARVKLSPQCAKNPRPGRRRRGCGRAAPAGWPAPSRPRHSPAPCRRRRRPAGGAWQGRPSRADSQH